MWCPFGQLFVCGRFVVMRKMRYLGGWREFVLFGSRARGDARRDSDYDVAVFIRDMDNRRTVDHALADTAYRYILTGFHIRPVAVPFEYLEAPRARALAQEIAREGIVVS